MVPIKFFVNFCNTTFFKSFLQIVANRANFFFFFWLRRLERVNYCIPQPSFETRELDFLDELFYAKYLYTWQGHEFIIYLVSGRDGDCTEIGDRR